MGLILIIPVSRRYKLNSIVKLRHEPIPPDSKPLCTPQGHQPGVA